MLLSSKLPIYRKLSYNSDTRDNVVEREYAHFHSQTLNLLTSAFSLVF